MKTVKSVVGTLLILSVPISGCATMKGEKSAQDLAASGPTVMQAKVEPDTIELNSQLRATQQPRIFADVKDFRSPITQVKLRFQNVPIEVRMSRLAGTTWQANLTPQQLKTMAVSGKTIKYKADVIATNELGQVASTKEPIEIAVKAPEASQLTG